MPACTTGQPVATCMHPYHCTHVFTTAHTCLQLPPLPRASRGISVSPQPRQFGSTYLVQDVMTFCDSKNQVDVVFSKFLPKKCQGRIILGGKKVQKDWWVTQKQRLISLLFSFQQQNSFQTHSMFCYGMKSLMYQHNPN